MATRRYLQAFGKMMSLGRSRQAKSRYEEAIHLYKEGSYARAAAILEELIGGTTLQEHLARFYHSRASRLEAERLLKRCDYASATAYLRQAATHNPHSTELIEFLADCYIRQDAYGRAGEEYGRLAELSPENPQGRVKEAMSYFLAGNSGRAIVILEGMAAEYSASFEVNYYLGMILAAVDESHRSISYLTRACQLRPESVDAHWKLGLAQGLGGHLVEAIHHLQQAHKLEPGNHWLLAQLTLAVGQARHQGFDITLDPAEPAETRSGRPSRSLEELAEMIIQEPDFVTAFLDLPQTEVDEQIFSSLLEILMRALERHPEYADLHYHCSCVYERLGEADKAIRASERALAINPRYVNAMVHLARLYVLTRQDQEAISRLNEALTLGANYADVHYLLGNLYHHQGALEEARQHYQEALKINRNFRAAEEALASLAA